MKIGPQVPAGSSSPGGAEGVRQDGKATGAERAQSTKPTEASASPSNLDRVSLSGATPGLATEPVTVPFDQKKVEEVRRAIQEGRFPVDAKRVADQLLADTRDLLGSQGANKP